MKMSAPKGLLACEPQRLGGTSTVRNCDRIEALALKAKREAKPSAAASQVLRRGPAEGFSSDHEALRFQAGNRGLLDSLIRENESPGAVAPRMVLLPPGFLGSNTVTEIFFRTMYGQATVEKSRVQGEIKLSDLTKESILSNLMKDVRNTLEDESK